MAIMSVNEIEIFGAPSSSEFLVTFGVSEPFNSCINHVEAISGTAGLAVFPSLFIPFTVVWKTQWNCTLFSHVGVGTNLLISLLQTQIKASSTLLVGETVPCQESVTKAIYTDRDSTIHSL